MKAKNQPVLHAAKKGSRVGALLSASDVKCELLGYGVYIGNRIPVKSVMGLIAVMLRSTKRKNPVIQLDNGQLVWGCECWWGPEDEVRAVLADRNIIPTDIDKERAKWKQTLEKSNMKWRNQKGTRTTVISTVMPSP